MSDLDNWRLLFLTATGSADRMSPRHVFETRIRIRLQRDTQRLTLEGWSRDLSESRLGAFVAQALVLGEFVTLEIPLEDSDEQVIPAKVAVVTVPVFNCPAVGACDGTAQLPIVGFLQLGIQYYIVTGDISVVVLNVAGCDPSNTGFPISGAGTSPVPVRLIR